MELRTVLTAEVAQRHDQLVTLRDELKDQEQKHHETRMQLQLKTQVIKDLRKEVRDLKERQMVTVDKVIHFHHPPINLNTGKLLPPVKKLLLLLSFFISFSRKE